MKHDDLNLDSLFEGLDSFPSSEYDLTGEQITDLILKFSEDLQKDAELIEIQSAKSIEIARHELL